MVNAFIAASRQFSRRHTAWLHPLSAILAGLALSAHAGLAQSQEGQGLAWGKTAASPMWPHWEGRIGVVLDHAVESPRQSFALTLPVPIGLKVHGAHVLSDYYFSGGFRATAGLVRGPANLPWWPTSGQATSGLDLSLDGIDVSALPTSGTTTNDELSRTSAYIGAGYSTRLNHAKAYGAWHFNADLGLISLNSGNIGRFTRVLQGEQGVDELLRELRLRPVLKVSVDYAF